jgi:ketosteroid isomerase-like protein
MLVGSEPGEIVRGGAALAAFFAALFAASVRLTWNWQTVEISNAGDTAWFFAEGEVVIQGSDGERRRPYRLSGVLSRIEDAWKWRLFHGSEPKG